MLLKQSLQALYIKNQEKNYVTADEYLSGNVREKLAIAHRFATEDKEFDINVKALESVQPVDLTADEIEVRIGATWIPEDVIKIL